MGAFESKDQANPIQTSDGHNFIQKSLSGESSQTNNIATISTPIEERYRRNERVLIKGNDRRVPIDLENLLLPPYSTVVQIEARFENGFLFGGSGVLIGPSHVLTAAHNVFDPIEGRWANLLRVIPAKNNDYEPFGHTYASHIYKFIDCDLALLTLEKPIGNQAKWLDMFAITNKNELHNKSLSITGYPNIENQSNRMFTHQGPVQGFDGRKMSYKIDTSGGQSGSPVWIQGPKGDYLIVGIHANCGSFNEGVNHGVVISKDRLARIKLWMNEVGNKTTNPEGVDLTPMTPEKETIAIHYLQERWTEIFKITHKENKLRVERVWEQRDRIKDDEIRKVLTDIAMKWNATSQNLWKSFIFDISCCDQLTDQALKNIGAEIGGSLKHIQQLRLCFDECKKITNQGVDILVDLIGSNLCNLTKLSIDFKGCKYFSNNGIKSLANHLKNKYFAIHQISFDFSWCNDITDQGIEDLAIKMGETLRDLRILNLDFNWCQLISDEGVKKFATHLITNNLANLKILDLDFSWCENLTDQALTTLGAQIGSHLQNLRFLCLSFNSCPDITNDGPRNLIFQINKNCNKITFLKLDFSSCEKITDQGIFRLTNQIKDHFPELSRLVLDFSFCSQVTEKSKRFIESSLKHISFVGIDIWGEL